MTLTFISPFTLTSSKFVSASNTYTSTCSRTGRPNFARHCPSHAIAVACASPPKETQVPDEEEKLDEAAMRAADIHEVLKGLRDFKDRIIEGKLPLIVFFCLFIPVDRISGTFRWQYGPSFGTILQIDVDATKLAKKVRAPKKQLEAALAAHPDIGKIDVHIAELEEELKVLGDR